MNELLWQSKFGPNLVFENELNAKYAVLSFLLFSCTYGAGTMRVGKGGKLCVGSARNHGHGHFTAALKKLRMRWEGLLAKACAAMGV